VTGTSDADGDGERRNTGADPDALMSLAGTAESASTRSARLAREAAQPAAEDPATAVARENADKARRLAPTPGLNDRRLSPGATRPPLVSSDHAEQRRQHYGQLLRELRDNARHDFGDAADGFVGELQSLDGHLRTLIDQHTTK